MDRQTLRDWVYRYNETGVPGLLSRLAPGRQRHLSEAQMAELRELVVAGPDPEIHKVIRWRCVDLRDEVTRRFAVTVNEGTIGKWLHKLDLTPLQPRPFHPKKDAAAQATFKKLPCRPEASPAGQTSRGGGRGLVPDAMKAETAQAESADWQASATGSGSLPACLPRPLFASPSNSASHRGSSPRGCPALQSRGCTGSKVATRRRY
jgi:transposase